MSKPRLCMAAWCVCSLCTCTLACLRPAAIHSVVQHVHSARWLADSTAAHAVMVYEQERTKLKLAPSLSMKQLISAAASAAPPNIKYAPSPSTLWLVRACHLCVPALSDCTHNLPAGHPTTSGGTYGHCRVWAQVCVREPPPLSSTASCTRSAAWAGAWGVTFVAWLRCVELCWRR